ncbi:MAG: GyrI-like domain-containing protein [Alphaproteobacteria bacterium]|jgi:effector-binding domain-containing protein|nr:GyrI-like domain-containing protein [Alphaproteobacteria bacterium]
MSNYKINIEGIVETEDFYLIGYERFTTSHEGMISAMKEDFTKLGAYATKVKAVAPAVAVYKSFDPETMNAFILNAIPVEPTEETAKECVRILEEKGIWAVIPPFDAVLKVTLEGSYNHLMEVWTKAYEFIAENELIVDSYASPWESYKVDPSQTGGDDSKLITEIFIPLIPMEEVEEE